MSGKSIPTFPSDSQEQAKQRENKRATGRERGKERESQGFYYYYFFRTNRRKERKPLKSFHSARGRHAQSLLEKLHRVERRGNFQLKKNFLGGGGRRETFPPPPKAATCRRGAATKRTEKLPPPLEVGKSTRGLALSRRRRLRATRVERERLGEEREEEEALEILLTCCPWATPGETAESPPCRGEGALASASGRAELVRRRISLLGERRGGGGGPASLLYSSGSGTVRRAQPCHNSPIASGQGLPGKRRALPSPPEAVPQAQAERRGRSRDARLSTRAPGGGRRGVGSPSRQPQFIIPT